MVSSVIYAIGILVIGAVLYLADVFVSRKDPIYFSEVRRCLARYFSKMYLNATIPQSFNIYLCAVGILWLLWLHVDIEMYIRMMKSITNETAADLSKFTLVEGPDGELLISVPVSAKDEKIPQYYCFSTGRHSGSFFLKIGAAAFCLGHLVHSGLNLGRQVRIWQQSPLLGLGLLRNSRL